MQNSYRVFFAIELPNDIQASMAIFLQTRQKHELHPAIRWTSIENLHLTLQFLAKIRIQDVPILIKDIIFLI